MQILDLSDDIPKLNFLIHADSGAGKTVFAGSDRKVLFIAPEDSGTLSALRMGSKAKKIKVKSANDVQAAYEYLYANPEIVAQFDWIVIDSLTELQKLAMKDILVPQRQKRINEGQDPDLPQIQDYGKLYVWMEDLVRAFNDLDVNVLYTSLSRTAESPHGEEFLVPMIGSNKLKDYKFAMKIVALMTSYAHLKTEIVDVPAPTEEDPKAVKATKQRVLIWEDMDNVRAKDRTTRLGPFTVNANLQQIRMCANGTRVRDTTGKIVKPTEVTGAAPIVVPKVVVPQPSPEADTSDKVDSVATAETQDSTPAAEPEGVVVDSTPETEAVEELALDAVEA